MNEKWKKALKHLNINENMLVRKEELCNTEPFLSNNIKSVETGHFKFKQLDKICLEIVKFEVVNGCFQAQMRDLQGDEIQATFHSDCKEIIKTHKCRKGSLAILKDVSLILIKYLQVSAF